MNSENLKKLEKLVKASLIASNYIEKNITEGVEFKNLEYLPTIVDWMESHSGFDGDLILQSMEKYYNRLLENSKNENSLIKNILISEAKQRLFSEMGITVND